MPQGIVIAIDGPVASGKESLAKRLATRLSGFHLYTGAMYRCVALLCIQRNLDVNEEDQVVSVLSDTNVDFRDNRIFLNEEDVTDRIKEPDTANGASIVGVYKSVRDELVKKQQHVAKQVIAEGQTVIAEGRDIGTEVLPDADLKIFLTADLKIRAQRRQMQYEAQGITKTIDEVLKEIEMRDKRDKERKFGPLSSDPTGQGYWTLDNSNQSEEESVDSIINKLQEKGLIL